MTTNSLLSILIVAFCCVFSLAQNGNGKDGILCSSTDLSATLLKAAGKVSGTAVEGSLQFVSDIQSLLDSLLFKHTVFFPIKLQILHSLFFSIFFFLTTLSFSFFTYFPYSISPFL
jgi:hypothetical protein